MCGGIIYGVRVAAGSFSNMLVSARGKAIGSLGKAPGLWSCELGFVEIEMRIERGRVG